MEFLPFRASLTYYRLRRSCYLTRKSRKSQKFSVIKQFCLIWIKFVQILQNYLEVSKKYSIFGFAEDTFARKNKKKQDFLWFFPHLIVSLHCQNESFDYAAECGEQDLIDTTPFKSHPRVTFIFRISYELTCGIVD